MLNEFARDLRIIREQKDISLKSIAQQTRLNISVLESIENGDFTFQPQTYIRAFIKQYAACLDLDVEEVLFDYDLARSGKYKQKFPADPGRASAGTQVTTTDEPDIQEKETKEEILPGVSDEKEEEARKTDEPVKEGSEESYLDLPETGNKVRIVRDHPVKKTSVQIDAEKSPMNLLASPVFRNIALILLGLLILFGLYLLVNALFLDNKKDNTEIIRQDFNEVVKEQEQRLLKKKTPEEIRDSIKKANDSLKAAAKDSLTFTIKALTYGEIYVVTDSLNYDNPKKVIYDEGQTKTFKAKRSFHITTGNTKSFEAMLNGKPVEFDTKAVRKVKVTPDGVFR